MRYYVTADVHGFYTPLQDALRKAGFFADTEPHLLVILGDLFDRGKEAMELQQFILQLMENDAVILIRGNHEDLYESLVNEDCGIAYRHHKHNGTYDTALQLTGFDKTMAFLRNFAFADAGKATPFYRKIIPAMRDYYETQHYVFVHGWIPCMTDGHNYSPIRNWRDASPEEWRKARWYHGMDAVRTTDEAKTILCGHVHASYGHFMFEKSCSEFGPDADFTPYYGHGIIALDACTAISGFVNCVVLEDQPLSSD